MEENQRIRFTIPDQQKYGGYARYEEKQTQKAPVSLPMQLNHFARYALIIANHLCFSRFGLQRSAAAERKAKRTDERFCGPLSWNTD